MRVADEGGAASRASRSSSNLRASASLGSLSFPAARRRLAPSPSCLRSSSRGRVLFYLLDEVEAALDDANIGRFTELLRRFADRAQFIVVTHQKRTIEAADILYGVTMGADGISQVVSKRLQTAPQAEALSA